MSNAYFTDRDLRKKFPQILADAGLAVERHGDLFPPDGSDEQWLEYCGKNGRIAITHNQRIRYRPNELAAVVRYRVALLVVIGNAPFPDLARHFANSMRRIEAFVDRHEPPYIQGVSRCACGPGKKRKGCRERVAVVSGLKNKRPPPCAAR